MKNFATFFVITTSSFFSHAAGLDNCLQSASKKEHRLDRIEATQACFQKNLNSMRPENCFAAAEKLKQSQKSEDLSEQMKALCFYQVSVFKTVQACLQKVSVFTVAQNHDEAIFECYTQFQDAINKTQCLKIGEQLIYPAKKEYLISHCLTK